MAHALDIGPISWIYDELDDALTRAAEIIAQAADAEDSQAQIQSAQKHLHRAQGALSVVDLDGPTQFSTLLDYFVSALAHGDIRITADTTTLASRACSALANYLSEAIVNGSNQPLRLFTLYRELAQASGRTEISAAEMFFPDLDRRLPRRHTTPALDGEALTQRLRGAQAAFERGLLSWLRSPQDPAGAQTMRDAAAVFEAHQDSHAALTLWRVAQGFFDALAHGDIPASELRIKQICTGLAKEARSHDGGRHIPARVLRDLLFEIGQAPARTDTQREIRTLWNLDDWWHQPATPPADMPLGALLRSLRAKLNAVKQEWDHHAAGQASALPAFNTHLEDIAEESFKLGRPALQRLLQGIARLTQWLSKNPDANTEALTLDVATALLTAELSLSGGITDDELQNHAATALAQFEARIQGRSAPEETPHFKAVHRAQEWEARQQVAREIQSNLNHIEQTLDDYFRDHSRHAPLTQLATPLHQIEGALLLIGGEAALPLLREAGDTITGLTNGTEPDETHLDRLADRLSILGFYVDALQHGPADFEDFLPAEERSARAAQRDAHDAFITAETPSASLPDSPAAFQPEVTAEVEPQTTVAAPDADSSAPTLAEATSPSSVDAGSDVELLEIFIEEAHHVLATIANERAALATRGSQEPLITIRRGVHTLKGSGRMVGLTEFGETAWEVEQTLNRWLQLEWPVTEELKAFIDHVHDRFDAWVAHIEHTGELSFDTRDLLAEAEDLRARAEPDTAAPAPDSPADIATERSSDSEEAEFQPSNEPASPPALAFDFNSLPTLDLDEALARTADDENTAPALDADLTQPPTEAPSNESAVADAEPGTAEPSLSASVPIGDVELSRQLFDLYVTESGKHLHALREGLRPLHSNPSPPSEQLLRAVHTLSGISSTAHIKPLQGLARATEFAFGRLREAQQAPTPEQVDLFSTTLECMEAMLAEIVHQRMPLAAPELEEQLENVGHSVSASPAVEDSAQLPGSVAAETDDADAPLLISDDLDEQLLPIFLAEAEDLLKGLDKHLREWQGDENNPQHLRLITQQLHTLKGSARMAGAMRLGERVHRLESRLEHGITHASAPAHLIEGITGDLDQIAQVLTRLAAGESEALATDNHAAEQETTVLHDAAPSPLRETIGASAAFDDARTLTTPNTLRMRADHLDEFINAAGEVGISRTRIEGELRTVRRSLLDLTENVIRLRNQLREVELQAETQMQNRIAQADSMHAEFDPLEMDRYTRLQELTRFMAESVSDVTTVQQNLLHNLDSAELALHGQARITRDLQQALMQVRMVPFDSLSNRLYRVVRQSAKDLGKRVNLDIHGGRIELDRSILEHMTVAIEHMLRNAVAHGIEPIELRREANKDEIGQITISVSQIGNEIAIDLTDDGCGLDLDAIRTRAIERELLGEDEETDEHALINLIFTPGFSTADEVSTVAGRGVGMDVVRAEATALGGRVDVESRSGEGMRFRIYLPLTLAVTQGLIVRAGRAGYALPSTMIAQVLELRADALERLRADGHTEWEGEYYPYRYLPELLGDSTIRPEINRFNWVLLLRAGGERLALHVDQLHGNQEIVVKSAGPQLLRVIGISGATVLGDGEIVLILNPLALTSRRMVSLDATETAATPSEEAESQTEARSSVLVVDDSLTVRKITGRMLEREGYQVATAKDGADALEQLAENVPDIILSDIEMPRMDGFDLVRNLRADPRTRDIPVIMITSRLADKHRDYARKLGANEYLGKPYDEDELLALLRQYTHEDVALSS